jgi:hypothetical protein
MTVAIPEPKLSIRERVLGPTAREKYQQVQLSAVEGTLDRILNRIEDFEIDGLEESGGFGTIQERLADVELMIDTQGWHSIFNYDDTSGLTLRQVKEASQQLRELVVGNPFIQNGSRVRNAHVWGGDVEFSTVTQAGKPGKISARIVGLTQTPNAKRYIFGNSAREELERAAFTDGILFILGENATKRTQRIQIAEITADLRNPNNTEEIWAYRRVWYQNPTATEEIERKQMVRWYYTDICPDSARQGQINHGGAMEVAELGYTMIDQAFNRQVGWAYGVPDALAVIAWARLYREFLVNGYVMSRSLARFAYKVTVGTKAGAKNAATEVTAPGQAGATAIEGQGNQLASMATAGKGYDFASGKPIAAAIAAGLGVSLLALLSDPSAATGSNAAAQTLDPIAKATAVMRRRTWDDFFDRMYAWYGLTSKLVKTWGELTDDTVQRVLQSINLADQLEVFGPDVIQGLASNAFGLSDPGAVPAGWKTKSKRKPVAAASGDSTTGDTGDANGRGQGSPAGKAPNDHTDDPTT